MTEENIQKAMEYVARKMVAEELNITDAGVAVRWLIENPLPTRAEYEAEMAVIHAEEKAAKIVALQEELDRLQGSE
jgi:hypothetical protein